MNKTLVCALILFCAVTAMLFAGRKEIDDFIASYEASVLELEELAKKPSVTVDDMIIWGARAEELSDKGQKLERDPALTAEDSKRMQALASRFQKRWRQSREKCVRTV